MKKSIFLFFAAILYATSAWAWCGNSFITVNGLWCTGSNSYVHDGGKFDGKNLGTLTTFELGGQLEVYPKSSDAATMYYRIDSGDAVAITMPKTGEEGNNSIHQGSAIIDIPALSAGSHTIAVWFNHGSDWDSNNSNNFTATFTVASTEEPETPVEPEPVANVTVHFINTPNWAEVACHHWIPNGAGTSWPGEVLSKTDEIAGYDVYTATFTGAHTSCIFNNNNKGSQTGDLTVNDGKYYEVNTNTWYDDKAAAEAALATPIPDETVYLINTGNWSKVMIHTWNGVGGTAWPGVEMTPTGETIEGYDVYSYTAKQGGQANLLFQESADVNKTGDLEWNAGKYYAPSKNKWYDTKEDAKEDLAAPVVDVYTVVGSSAPLFGETWKETKTENEMTVIEGTKYQLVKNEVSLAVDNIEYKVVINHDWNQAYPAANEILPITEAGKYNVTFTFDSNTKEVGATAELIEAAVVLPTVGVKGAWDGWAATTTLTGDNTSASATVNIATAGIYEFGLDVDGNFQASGATIDKANNSTVVTTNAGNMKLTANVLGDYTFTWTYETKTLVVTYPAGEEVEIAKKYYIAGTQNLTGFDWQVDGLEIAKVGDVYKHAFSEMSADIYEFKITDGTWTNQWGFSNLAANYVGVEQGKDGEGNPNGNIKIVTEEAKNIIVIFDPANNKITLENWEIAAPTTISYVLMGVNGDWTNGIPMTVNPDNADEYVLTDQVIIKATDAIKVVTLTDGQATAWCGTVDSYSNATHTADASGNIVLEDGIYTFYFKKTANNIYINQTGYARNVANKYGTICLPYASASTTGATFFEVVGQEAGNVYLASVTSLTAGVPYIFEKNQSATQIKVVYTGEKETTAGSANGLVGTFADNTTVPNNAYILYGGAFCTNNNPTKPNKINAYRAYLDLSAVEGGAPTQKMPGRRYIGMSVQGENEATGVEDLFTTDAPVKVIQNGQLIIIRDGVKYNVQGQVIR